MDIFIPKTLLASVGVCLFILIFVLIILLQYWRFRRKGRFSPFTEDIFRLPGHSVRKAYGDLQSDFTIYYIAFTFAAFVFMGVIAGKDLLTETTAWVALLLFSGSVLMACLFKIVGLFDKLQAVVLGCEGEEYTGQELNLLMLKGAFVFHDIPYRYGNIDHVVVGNDTVFAVETKAVRKPARSGSTDRKEATVGFDGKSLSFPHFTTTQPIEQAKRHAQSLEESIQKKCGIRFRVMPVVALPGWHIEINAPGYTQLLVINLQRGTALSKWLGNKVNDRERKQVINYLASVARSVPPSSKRTDPNADRYYDTWLNPRNKEKLLGDES